MADEDVDEPFFIRDRTTTEMEEYDAGFKAGNAGKECDDSKSLAWLRGLHLSRHESPQATAKRRDSK